MEYSMFYNDFMDDFNNKIGDRSDCRYFNYSIDERNIMKGINGLIEHGKLSMNPTETMVQWNKNKSLLIKLSFKKIFSQTKNLVERAEICAISSVDNVTYVDELDIMRNAILLPSVLKCLLLYFYYNNLVEDFVDEVVGFLQDYNDDTKYRFKQAITNFIDEFVKPSNAENILINI